MGLINIPGKAHTAADKVSVYLEWVQGSVRLLRNVLRTEDLDRLILSRRYWAIQSSAAPWLAAVVDTELDDRRVALDDAMAFVSAQEDRWNNRAGRIVVADTTVWCQFDKLEQADFAELLEWNDIEVRIVFPMVVIDELDSLKRSGNSKVRWRAGYTLAVLDRVLGPSGEGELRPGQTKSDGTRRGRVGVEVLPDPPGHQREPINDDEIVSRSQELASWFDRDLVLLTYDTGQATRARTSGLEVHKLREELGPEL